MLSSPEGGIWPSDIGTCLIWSHTFGFVLLAYMPLLHASGT